MTETPRELSADERNLLLSETPGWLRYAAIQQHQSLASAVWEHGCREHAACRTYLAYCEWMKRTQPAPAPPEAR
jgi:hypothetical protein